MSKFVFSKEDAQWLITNWKPGYSSAFPLFWCLYTTEDDLTRNDKYWHMKCHAPFYSLNGRFTEIENTGVVVRALGYEGRRNDN